MYTRNLLFIACLCFLFTACGYGREDDKEASRQEDLQGLQQEMEQLSSRIDSLKSQVSDRQSAAANGEQYGVMMAKLRRAEVSYREWNEEVEFEPEGTDHDERMQYYSQKEQRAQAVRQEMRSAVQYVENELQ